MFRNIYIYWVGKEYKLILILRKLIYLHSTNGKGYNVVLLNEKNIKEYIENIPEYFNDLSPAHQADFVRVNVICDKGGIWLDSDTLVLDSLDSLFDIIETNDGFFIRENNWILWNGIFGSKPNTSLMIKWKNNMLEILKQKNKNIGWTEIGNHMLQGIYDNDKSLYENYTIFNGLDNLYPINWDRCCEEYINKPFENYKTIIKNYQPLIALVNSVYHRIEHLNFKEIMEGNMPLNYFINKSIENKRIDKNTLYTNYMYDDINPDIFNDEYKNTFESIYSNKIWNNGNDNIPLSGPGSLLVNATQCLNMLNDFIYKNNCKSVLDLGCGDLTWIPKASFFSDSNIKYTGVDIVENLIYSHQNNYPNKIFLNKDITKFNNFNFTDIIIIRDVIFHLKNEDIISIFNNIRFKFNYILITSCKNIVNSDNFDQWHFSEKNIHKPPFNISHNFLENINENNFNRDVYIYKHNDFYNINSN